MGKRERYRERAFFKAYFFQVIFSKTTWCGLLSVTGFSPRALTVRAKFPSFLIYGKGQHVLRPFCVSAPYVRHKAMLLLDLIGGVFYTWNLVKNMPEKYHSLIRFRQPRNSFPSQSSAKSSCGCQVLSWCWCRLLQQVAQILSLRKMKNWRGFRVYCPACSGPGRMADLPTSWMLLCW